VTDRVASLAARASTLPVRTRPRRWAAPVLLLTALVGFIVSLLVAREYASGSSKYLPGHLFVIDPTSVLFMVLINAVFFAIAVYILTRVQAVPELEQDMPRVAALATVFMVAMNLTVMCNHLILMWALIEGTALAAAPLVARGETGAAPRAAWHYLLYSTISLSITFVGFLCLARSAALRHVHIDFAFDALGAALSSGSDLWQRLGIALVLFGFGSKLGLAPLYGWLPEAYDTAPPSVSATLAGVQFNATLVALLRVLHVFRADDSTFVANELLIMGCLSLVVAAMQVMATRNYKRLIAYVCVGSSGVIAIGLAVGRAAAYGVILYVVSNAFVKTLLFLSAGRLTATYGTKSVTELGGVLKELPVTGPIFMVGTFALLGFPPFGSFMAEMLILSGIVQAGHFMVFVLLCVTLTIIFVATGRALFPMIWGPPKRDRQAPRESLLAAPPKLMFIAVLVLLGIYTPEPAARLMRLVAASIGEP
jgi:hydrogenase-4 component F